MPLKSEKKYPDVGILTRSSDEEYKRDDTGKLMVGVIQKIEGELDVRLLLKRNLFQSLVESFRQWHFTNNQEARVTFTLASKLSNWNGEDAIRIRDVKFIIPQTR